VTDTKDEKIPLTRDQIRAKKEAIEEIMARHRSELSKLDLELKMLRINCSHTDYFSLILSGWESKTCKDCGYHWEDWAGRI
jgi:hypothetical protein